MDIKEFRKSINLFLDDIDEDMVISSETLKKLKDEIVKTIIVDLLSNSRTLRLMEAWATIVPIGKE